MKKNLIELLRQWKTGQKIDRQLFSENFIYDVGAPMLDANYFLSQNDNQDMVDCSEIEIIEHLENINNEVIIFDFFEEITNLYYRRCWVVDFEGELIKKILEIKQNIIRKNENE